MKVYKKGNAPAGAVYIGRGSKWGNPFVIGKDGTRDEVIQKFAEYALDILVENPNWLAEIRNKDVYCYCAPLRCHGDVLASFVKKGNE